MKKFAKLLPNNWLADTPHTLGRQSAERERIAEISWNLLKKKIVPSCKGMTSLLKFQI
ncbi:hypothetical protein [Peribacillus phoenicis]|uniref:hypothetical protein n=1 Tax=Peribacillus sp. 1P06PA-2 TaxID=3132295 RepID=UPI0039A706A1